MQIYHEDAAAMNRVQTTTLWDRKVDGGFPETKVEFYYLPRDSVRSSDLQAATKTTGQKCD